MELGVLIDPLVGRDYSTGYVPSRPIDFQKSMAFLRGQLDALADTEVFDTLNAIPRPAEEANASHSGGAKTSASKNGPIQQKEARPIIRGGGGLQGPSVADAVNVDALMAELAGGPRA
ncbi:hypothetical protein DL93DRAFT_2087833 [Clavulina sp. PMI_390]|nr:hypothetical protein DL93DRAFT_2087833 [Clavulina sp. PMI_390]